MSHKNLQMLGSVSLLSDILSRKSTIYTIKFIHEEPAFIQDNLIA